MKFLDLHGKLTELPVFRFEDMGKLFPNEDEAKVRVQLSRWTAEGKLHRLRRGLYCLAGMSIREPFALAQLIYSPSYISLESALNYHGIIPDVPNAVTSVSIGGPREFSNVFGTFSYRKIRADVFHGFRKIESGLLFYLMAEPEKALADYCYYKTRGVYSSRIEEMRLVFPEGFSAVRLTRYASDFNSPALARMIERILREYGGGGDE